MAKLPKKSGLDLPNRCVPNVAYMEVTMKRMKNALNMGTMHSPMASTIRLSE